MANAEVLGRPERTPSVGSTRDREHWADFGAAAREDDGRPTGGDVLELLVRTSGRSKAQVLRELGREMVAEARAELESAAARQVDPPAWVQAIMSEAGWSHYRRLRDEYQQRKPSSSGRLGDFYAVGVCRCHVSLPKHEAERFPENQQTFAVSERIARPASVAVAA